MPQRKRKTICCPECGREKDISIFFHTLATLRAPVKDGIAQLGDDLLREPQIAGTEVVVRYSNSDGTTKLIFFEEEMELEVDCPKCGKAFDLPKGTVVECKGAR